MKIGLSFSQCILDIDEGRVEIDDILIIIARTCFDMNDSSHWTTLWNGYRHSVWAGFKESDEDRIRRLVEQLWDRGLIHQPRTFGAMVHPKFDNVWLETVLTSTELETNHVAREAWDNFQVIAGLANVKLDEKYH